MRLEPSVRDVKHVDQTSLAQQDAVRFPSLTEITRNMKTGSAKWKRNFLICDGALVAKFITDLERLDHWGSRTHVTSRFHGPVSWDRLGEPAAVPCLGADRGRPLPNVKNMAEEVEYCGAGAWIKLLRAYRGKNAGRRTWPLQTVEETRFPTKCPRSLWSCPTSFSTLRPTRTSSIRLACACVQSRDVKRLVQTESNPWIRALQRSTGDEFVEPHEDDELDLNALTVKGKGSEDNCFFFHCGQYGHRVAEWWKRDTWWGARERARGLSITATIAQYGRGKCGYGNAETWRDPWTEGWADRECTLWRIRTLGNVALATVFCSDWRWRGRTWGDSEVQGRSTMRESPSIHEVSTVRRQTQKLVTKDSVERPRPSASETTLQSCGVRRRADMWF